jgi:N-acetyl-gamma-glutamyl-phosphate reductase
MKAHAGLSIAPVFAPAVIPAHRGMLVEVPLSLEAMPGAGSPQDFREALAAFYEGSPIVTVATDVPGEMLLRASMEPIDSLTLRVFASEDGTQARLVALLDNLGKGASGAAVQNLNLMAGLDETAGLRL